MSKIAYTDKVAVNVNAGIPDINKVNAADMNEIKTVVNGLDDYRIADELNITNLQTGWNDATETWTFASVDDPTGVFYASGNQTTKYSAGMRIKMTNGGNTIFGIITVVGSYDSGNDRTPITFLHEIDPTDNLALYLMANSAITNNYYSNMKAPYGFPLTDANWRIKVEITSDLTMSSPSTTDYKIFGSAANMVLPIGAYNYKVKCSPNSQAPATTRDVGYYIALSEANNAISSGYSDTLSFNYIANATGVYINNLYAPMLITKQIVVTAKTTIYIVGKVDVAGSTLQIRGTVAPLIINAVCAYL